jgi:hypothetical protein
MLETERKYRALGVKPVTLGKKPRTTGRKKKLEPANA